MGNPEVAREVSQLIMETLLVNSVNPVQVELTDFVGNPVLAREVSGKLWKPSL